MGTWGVAILILVVAAALVGAFFLVWHKDRTRSQGVADDDRRLDPEERKRTHEARRSHEARRRPSQRPKAR